MGRLAILFGITVTLMLSACGLVEKRPVESSKAKVGLSSMNVETETAREYSKQPQVDSYQEILQQYAQFKQQSKLQREQSLSQTWQRHQQQRTAESRLRYALLLSLDKPDQALALLNGSAQEAREIFRQYPSVELIVDLLKREQNTAKKMREIRRQSGREHERVKTLESQIEALKSIESSMYEREEGFVLDAR